ncbi:hypothetical protein SAMN04489760_1506 [Syntrophus gentianae]|uniref:Uncharacterized protein n=1 Tax=Syntrophus gentianae TaxID=43775 RepID=A0A1H8BEK1_9BACT|nr:hypothetical protein [Syntrophus gentianae]SEM80428.1 hypothetical protein SAMN04489760_1506 [Syntrophus gentianae]
MQRKYLTLDEWKALIRVSAVIYEAMMAVYGEIDRKEGRSRNRKLKSLLKKAFLEFYSVKFTISNLFRGQIIHHGVIRDEDLDVFVEFMRDYIKQRK